MLGRSPLSGRGLGSSSTTPAVITDVVHRSVVDDRSVKDVSDVCPAHVIDHGVVVEEAMVPVPARIPGSEVAKAIINAAIESDRRPPVACMPHIPAVVPAPVTRSPKRAHKGRPHPCAGHPVVAVSRVPSPVARGPDVARTKANWLRIHR
jgi:hypothetical protein